MKSKICFRILSVYLQCFFVVYFVYTLEITTICHNMNIYKIYALFGMNYFFKPEIMFVYDLGHLDIRHLEGTPSAGPSGEGPGAWPGL